MIAKLDSPKKLLPENIKTGITPLERKLLEACVNGIAVSGETNKRTTGKRRNIIRGEFISWLCGNKEASKFIHHSGIDVECASIVGEINLIGATLEFPLRLKKCVFLDSVTMTGATLVNLDLRESILKEVLDLEFIKTSASLIFNNGFHSEAGISLVGAEIRGNLDCSNGVFMARKEFTIDAALASIRGSVFMDKSRHLNGTLSFLEADIRGSIDCEGGSFENPEGNSILLERAKVTGSVFLRSNDVSSFTSIGTVRLYETWIGGALECDGGQFERVNKEYNAINAYRLNVIGSVFLRNKFKAVGCVNLYGSKIGHELDCSDATIENSKSESLVLTKSHTDGNVNLGDGFNSNGTVSLHEALIGGTLDCEKGKFSSGENVNAINADGLNVAGLVLMRFGFSATGCVRMYGASIGSDLDCEGATFERNPSLKDEKSSETCFIGARMNVNGDFKLINQANPLNGDVFLEKAAVRSFMTDGNSLLKRRNANKALFIISKRFASLNLKLYIDTYFDKPSIHMDGFTYDYFQFGDENNDQVSDVRRVFNRLVWLSLRPTNHRNLQPYTQVIKALTTSGHGNEARKIAIARERQRSKNLSVHFRLVRDLFYGWTVDYGYSPAKALIFILAFIFAGYYIFGAAKISGAIIPTQGPVERQIRTLSGGRDQSHYYPYPEFVPLAYSIDVFFPIVDLHQEEYWMPTSTTGQGVKVLNYMWFHIAAGWLLTTLFVAAITGIVRTGTD